MALLALLLGLWALLGVGTMLSLGTVLAGPAGAAPRQDDGGASQGQQDGHVAVVEVSGLLDRVLVDFVEDQIDKAVDEGAIALVLQLNSKGAVAERSRLDRLIERIRTSPVPVDVWVGPSGSRAADEATELVAAARTTGVAPGSRIEVTRALVGDRSLSDRSLSDRSLSDRSLSDRSLSERNGDSRAAIGDDVNADTAASLDLVDNEAPTILEFLGGLPGVRSREVQTEDGPRLEPITQARFGQLPLAGQLFHTVASPPTAYLLFVIGLALLLFELFTAGVGVAGLVGAGCVILGSYGLAALPTNPLGVALLLLAIVGYGIDVQTGVPRVWSGIATVAFVTGSVLLYDGLSLSWVTLLVAIVGMSLAMLGGMPAMVRVRFSTPTIGREWMVGEIGTAQGPVEPEGVVLVRDAPWRARTSRVTPIAAGDPVRVVSISGLVLEVEPVDNVSTGQWRSH